MLIRSISTRRATAAVVACGSALSLVAFGGVALASTTKSAHKTVALPHRQTKTIDVGYPQALKHKGAKYSCTAKVSGPARSKVKILSRGSALGGSVCRVKAENTSTVPGLDGGASVTVTATTTW